jgi:hypothetical protein
MTKIIIFLKIALLSLKNVLSQKAEINFFQKKFGQLGKWLYLCTRFWAQWRDSSVG